MRPIDTETEFKAAMQSLDDDLVIFINGERLSVGEAMTVHVAIQAYAMDLTSKKYPLGRDSHGKTMTKSYLRHIGTINEKLLKNQK